MRAALITLLFALGFAGLGTASDRGTLALDGILSIRSSEHRSARVIVLPTGGVPYALEEVAGRFDLTLPLDGTYLLSFERDGLVTKQVYFDTTVPLERRSERMVFPFKVTLNPEGKDGIYAYAGPVGVVYYEASKSDFVHVTDYTLREGAPMAKRITQLMERMAVRGSDGLPVDRAEVRYRAVVPGMAATVEQRGDAAEGTASASATKTEVAPPAPVAMDAPREVLPTAPSAKTSIAAPVERTEVWAGKRLVPRPYPAAQAQRAAGTVRHIRMDALPGPPEPVQPPPLEELIVERNRVIRIVRVPEVTGHYTEYRRVADRFGNTVHFRDGTPIPEQLFRERTGH